MKILDTTISFVNTGFNTGAWNMHYDVQHAMALRSHPAQSIVRVFGWDPCCISLGRNQTMDDINLDLAYDDGIDVVHRPTGGRAIFHAEELTYTVIMPQKNRTPMDIYKLIGDALVTGLQYLVPNISLSKSQPDFHKLYNEPRSIPCFSSSARYEIECCGKKLVGSAQRLFGAASDDETDVVLQHGSILIGDAHQRLIDYLNLNDQTREFLRSDLIHHTTTLRELSKRYVSVEEVAECIQRGFEETWVIKFDEENAPDSYVIDSGMETAR